MLDESLAQAIEFADENDIDLPNDVRVRARQLGVIKAGDDLPSISAEYHNKITVALVSYFEGGSIVSSRNSFKRAMVDAFGAAFDVGWLDGGGELPVDENALDWFNARVSTEFGHIEELFLQARELRREDNFDYFTWITSRADGYTRSVLAIYNSGNMLAQKNKILIWRLGNTEKHCGTCANLDGQAHRASWYLARNYIPRQPGAAMLCGGYYCDCKLEDKEGNVITL